MHAHETERLHKPMGEPGVTEPLGVPREARKRSAASMVYLAIATILGTLLLVTSIRGCQQHSLRPLGSSEKWAHPSDHGRHAGAVTPASIGDGRPSRAEAHRQESNFGMVKRQTASASSTSSAASATGTVLVDFQVHQPVLTPEGATLDSGVSNGEAGDVQDSCQVVLMDYVFAYSYGEPYIGQSEGMVMSRLFWPALLTIEQANTRPPTVSSTAWPSTSPSSVRAGNCE